MGDVMKPIGPSFYRELLASGVGLNGIAWTAAGDLFFNEDVSEADRQFVADLYAAHDPETPAPPPVPEVVSRFQGREAMHRTAHGDGTLFEAVEALLAQPDTPAWYRRAWDDLQEFRRDSEMLAAIAGLLGLTGLQIDALFILAADIQV